MKLSKLYTNNHDRFEPVKFLPWLNVVFAEIRLPENKTKDTHNLGKTTLGRIIDFCMLGRVDKQSFFVVHAELFREFVFYV